MNPTGPWPSANRGKCTPPKILTGTFYLRPLAVIMPVHQSMQTPLLSCQAAQSYKPLINPGLLSPAPYPYYMGVCHVHTKRIPRDDSAAGGTDHRPHWRLPAGIQPGPILYEITSSVPAGRRTGMESVSSGPISSWDTASAGLVPTVICL